MAMTSLDERLLVEAHNGGDLDAFASIVSEYSPSLYAHAMMRLGEPRAAEDAVQETFLRAYRAMPRFDGEFHLRAWLHRILTNVCFDEGDRRRRESRMLDRMASYADPSVPPPDEVIDLDRAFAQQEVASALASLPDAYREALELRYVDQLSFRELADATGVTEENARARVHRGRAALRRLISRPYAFIAFFVPALRKGERAAQAALSSGGTDAANSMSSMSTIAQQAPTFTRIAVELSGPMSTKAGIVAGVVAAAATTVAVPVASTVADHTIAPPPVPVAVAPAHETAEPLPAPQDTVVVVDPAATPPADAAVSTPTDAAPTDAAAAATDGTTASPSEQETFSAPPAAAASASAASSTDTKSAAPPTATSTPSAAGGSTPAPVAPVAGPQALTASGLSATGTPDQIALLGTASLSGATSVSGSLQGTLAVTAGATPTEPVRLDGTFTFMGADGSTQSIRLAMRANATTDASGVTTYLISAGRYELTDGTGTKVTGSLAGTVVAGVGAGSSFALTLS
jgi:RNA polymerase sigma-70 factor (ECF subfamily)